MKNLLIVDDSAAVVAARLKENRALRARFSVDIIELRWSENLTVELCVELKRRQDAGRLYDAALLGLRFGEPDGYDLSGYHLMPHIRRFFPKTPIVVCSAHNDMGELARSFRSGASWFLRKDELRQLPKVMARLLTPRPWEPRPRRAYLSRRPWRA